MQNFSEIKVVLCESVLQICICSQRCLEFRDNISTLNTNQAMNWMQNRYKMSIGFNVEWENEKIFAQFSRISQRIVRPVGCEPWAVGLSRAVEGCRAVVELRCPNGRQSNANLIDEWVVRSDGCVPNGANARNGSESSLCCVRSLYLLIYSVHLIASTLSHL